MLITDPMHFPDILADHHEVKGVALGECVGNHRFGYDELAHTHAAPTEKRYGWICFKQIILTMDDQLCRHELAHLLAIGSFGHDDLWRAKVLELGGFLHSYTFDLGPMVHYTVPSFEKNEKGDDTYGGWKKKLAEIKGFGR